MSLFHKHSRFQKQIDLIRVNFKQIHDEVYPNKVKYPPYDELGFLESKFKLIMSSVFNIRKEKAEIQVRKLTDCLSSTSTLPKWQTYKESGFKKHVVTL